MRETVTVVAERTVALAPHDVFARFGAARGNGWLFDAHCDEVRLGAVVSMRLPLDGMGGHPVEVLGRFSRVVPSTAIEIDHSTPWRGRLSLRFAQVGARETRVQVRAHVPRDGVEWLLRRRGLPLPEPPDDGALRIGLITNLSGAGAVFSMATELMGELAVDEVNADGGVGGRMLALVVADDATESGRSAIEAERMARLGCRAIFVSGTSECFDAICAVVAGQDVLVVHTLINEGGEASPTVVRFGERPWTQLDALVAPTMAATGAHRWYLVGQDYVWSYAAHTAARREIDRVGGQVVGEVLHPLGSEDFSTTIERIQRSGTELILSTLVGGDEIAFERQCEAAGLRESTRTVCLVLEETTLALIGPRAGEGLITALSYFQDNPVEGNRELLTRYRAAYGLWAPAVTALSQGVYEAIHRFARVVHVDPEASAAVHGKMLRRPDPSASDTIGARNLLRPRLYVAEARGDSLQVLDVVGPRT